MLLVFRGEERRGLVNHKDLPLRVRNVTLVVEIWERIRAI